MKWGYFSLDQKLKKNILSILSIWLFSGWFYYFSSYILKNHIRNGVPKIVETTQAIYQGLSKRPLYMEYVWKIVDNASGLICAEVLSVIVLSPFPLRNNLAWSRNPTENPVSGQGTFLKNHTTSMSYWPERAILSRDNGHGIFVW